MATQYNSSRVTDLEIKKCDIISAEGKISIKDAVVEINYFEDMFINCSSGKLTINDSMGLQNKFSWTGNEYLELELAKPGTEGIDYILPLKDKFRIYTNSGRHLTKDDNENLIVNFCSEELFLSEKIKISKSYKNKRIDEIVKDICKSFLGIQVDDVKDENGKVIKPSKLQLEKTLGTYHIVIPKLKPLEAINWLATLAISQKIGPEGGANYLFYKNRDGFFFKSILSIFNSVAEYRYRNPLSYQEDKTGGSASSGYWYGIKNTSQTNITSNEESFQGDPYHQIISYQIMNSFDSMESHQRGMFGNRLLPINFLTRTHEKADFNYDKYWNFIHEKIELYREPEMNSVKLTSNATDRFNSNSTVNMESTIKLYPSTTNSLDSKYIKSNLDDNINLSINRVENTIPYRYAQLALIGHTRLKILIPGDPFISIGRLVFINFPQTAKDAGGKKLYDRFLTGYYLVTCVRHKTDQENNFETVLELLKDSYTGKKLNDTEKTGPSSFDLLDPNYQAL